MHLWISFGMIDLINGYQNYIILKEYGSMFSLTVLFVQESQFFQHYELRLHEPPLGEGSFSVCRKCKHKQTGHEYAVKIVSRR